MSNEANETVDPKEHAQAAIVFALRDIARTLARAAAVQEALAANPSSFIAAPCPECGCRLVLSGMIGHPQPCPGCGRERFGKPEEPPPDWSVATQMTVDPGGTVTVEVAGLTTDEDGWRCACGRRPVLRLVADDPAKLSDFRQTVTGRPFGDKHVSPSYAPEPSSPWRDVKEELPEESTMVMVWAKSYAPAKSVTGTGRPGCDLAVRAGAKWVSDSGYEVTVTHWMPLPKEPTT